MTPKRKKQLQDLLFESLCDEYTRDEAYRQAYEESVIEEERDEVTVTYINGITNNFRIRYRPYFELTG